MKNLSGVVFVGAAVFLILFSMVSYQVRETEKVLITRFGKPVATIETPGWKFKLPSPISKVNRFDTRARYFEGVNNEETTTKGSEPIIVTSYLVWRIIEPLTYLESVRDQDGAERQLDSLLRNAQNTVIGQHYFSEFVNSDPDKIKFSQIEKEMLASIQQSAENDYGIGIEAVGIKKLGVSKEVTKNVFDRMKADRQVKTQNTLAQGKAEATKIEKDAEAKRTEILAIAEARANAIRGEGDAEAAKYYKDLEQDPEFAIFLRDIDALKKILKEKATIVFGTETEPMELLKKAPEIKPGK